MNGGWSPVPGRGCGRGVGLGVDLGIGLGIGLLLLGGCDQLWRSSLRCSEDRSLQSDENGTAYCQGTDLATPPSDGGILRPWPTPPLPVALGAMGSHPVSGLRINDLTTTNGMSSLNIFGENQNSYATSTATCSDTTLTAIAGAPFGGVVLDATSTEFGYTIYQSKTSPLTMTANVSRAPNLPINDFSLMGSTQPGFSAVDFDIKRKPIFAVINTQAAVLQWAYFDVSPPMFGNSTLPIAASPNATIWHAAHADFNKDGYQDYVFSTVNAAGTAVLSGCLSSVMPCAAGGAMMLGRTNELLATADFSDSTQLVRVQVNETPQLLLAKFMPAAGSTPPYALASAAPAYRFPPGYAPKFVAAGGLEGGQEIRVFVAGLYADKQLPTVFGFKLRATGELAAPPIELPLVGTPTAMVLGDYPCLNKQQLVIALATDNGSAVLAYEAPTL